MPNDHYKNKINALNKTVEKQQKMCYSKKDNNNQSPGAPHHGSEEQRYGFGICLLAPR